MYIYPDIQSNHRIYKSDIEPDNQSNTSYKYNTHLVQTQDEMLGEATHYNLPTCYNKFTIGLPFVIINLI